MNCRVPGALLLRSVTVQLVAGQRRLEPLRRGGRGDGGRQLDPVAGAEQAAGFEQAGRGEVLGAHQHARAEAEAVAGRIGLGGDDPGDAEPRLADREHPARRARRERRGDRDRSGHQPRAVGQRERPVQRIGGVDRLDLGEDAVVTATHHRAQPDRLRTRTPSRDSAARSAVGRPALRQLHGEVAAEDALAVVGDAAVDRRRQAADPGDRRDAEDEADHQQPQPRQAAAQFAQGEAEGGQRRLEALTVIPAKAGTHDLEHLSSWVPAFAGMTGGAGMTKGRRCILTNDHPVAHLDHPARTAPPARHRG